jgi:rhodanese-related sulfurtransferase
MPAMGAPPDWNQVDQALERPGASMPGDVHRYGFPRSDLHVTVDGVTLLPAFALGGWLAFKPDGDGAMVMGDLVLTEDEINPVMSKILASGIAVTAVHNHLLRAQPATFYMHVAGQGDAVRLAATLHDALAASRTPLAAPAAAAASKPDLDVEQVEQVIGRKGNAVGGVLQFGIPRGDTIKDAGMDVPPAMAAAYVDVVMANLEWTRIAARYRVARHGEAPGAELFTAFGAPTEEEAVISAEELRDAMQREPPVLLDVCLREDISRRIDMLPGATLHNPDAIDQWAGELQRGRQIAVYCTFGFQVSGYAVAELRRRGFDARSLTGGIAAWHAIGGPTVPLDTSTYGAT